MNVQEKTTTKIIRKTVRHYTTYEWQAVTDASLDMNEHKVCK